MIITDVPYTFIYILLLHVVYVTVRQDVNWFHDIARCHETNNEANAVDGYIII